MKKLTRNLFTILALTALLVVLVFSICSCGDHQHSFDDAWTSDSVSHYHNASCEHSEIVSDKALHIFGEAEIISEASCEADGLRKYTCTVCLYEKEEVITKTGHAYSSEYQFDEYGHWVVASCEHTSVMGEKKAHIFGEGSITKETSCGEAGIMTFICSDCSYIMDKEIPMLSHTYNEEWESNEYGHWHSASCEHTEELSTRATHNFDEGEIRVIENCFKDGLKVYTCLDCKYEKAEIIEKTVHTLGEDQRCTSCGYIEPSTTGLSFELNPNGEGYTLYSISSFKGTDLSIPSEYKGLPVTAISENVFRTANLNSVTIPATIKGFADNAFYYTGSEKPIATIYYTGTLKDFVSINFASYDANPINAAGVMYINNIPIRNLEIDNTIEKINSYAFYGCESLKKLTFGSNLKVIGDYAFNRCKNVTEIKFTASVDTIGAYAFNNCTSLTKINFAENGALTRIGNYSFGNCSSLESLIIPSTITEIGQGAFTNCKNIKNVTIPKSVVIFGKNAFSSVSNIETTTYEGTLEDWFKIRFEEGESAPVSADKLILASELLTDLVIPEGVESVPAGSLAGYRGLVSITIPSTCKTVEQEAFYGCYNVTSITIQEGVTDLGDFCFAYNPLVKEITIPNSMQTIGYGAFAYNIGLEKMTIPFAGYSRTATDEYSVFGYIFSDYGLYVDDYEANQQYNGTSMITYILPAKLKTIVYTGDTLSIGAFSACRFETVIITGNLKEIPTYSFSNCHYLKNITMPDSVEIIADFAFGGSLVLEEITFSKSLKSIGKQAFWYCKAIKEITIPASVEFIGAQAFEHIDALTKVTFENVNNWICYETLESENGVEVDVSNSESNKTLFGETYSTYYWKRLASTEE